MDLVSWASEESIEEVQSVTLFIGSAHVSARREREKRQKRDGLTFKVSHSVPNLPFPFLLNRLCGSRSKLFSTVR